MVIANATKSSRIAMIKAIATTAHQHQTTAVLTAGASRLSINNSRSLVTRTSLSSSSSLFSSVTTHQNSNIDDDNDVSWLPSSSSSLSSSWMKWNKNINNANNDDQTTIVSETNATTNSDNSTNYNDDNIIRNIQDFISAIPDTVRQRKIENIEPGAENDPVARLFRRSDLPIDAWNQYALFDESKPYTRNLISTDNQTYTLLLLCWNPAKESPIHDHPCDGCWLQILQGEIYEKRYDRQLNCVADLSYNVDNGESTLSYITDNVGYHKIGTVRNKKAVTLHLYAPPFDTCQCWYSNTNGEPLNPLEPKEGRNIHHSEYGMLCAA